MYNFLATPVSSKLDFSLLGDKRCLKGQVWAGKKCTAGTYARRDRKKYWLVCRQVPWSSSGYYGTVP